MQEAERKAGAHGLLHTMHSRMNVAVIACVASGVRLSVSLKLIIPVSIRKAEIIVGK